MNVSNRKLHLPKSQQTTPRSKAISTLAKKPVPTRIKVSLFPIHHSLFLGAR